MVFNLLAEIFMLRFWQSSIGIIISVTYPHYQQSALQQPQNILIYLQPIFFPSWPLTFLYKLGPYQVKEQRT
jgi:hypothetical protein